MIDCYLLDGSFYEVKKVFSGFDEIENILKENVKLLNSMPVEAVILILDEYSKRLSRDKQLLKITGTTYLSFYFRKSNIEKLIEINLKDKKYLNEFVPIGSGRFIRAQGEESSATGLQEMYLLLLSIQFFSRL